MRAAQSYSPAAKQFLRVPVAPSARLAVSHPIVLKAASQGQNNDQSHIQNEPQKVTPTEVENIDLSPLKAGLDDFLSPVEPVYFYGVMTD